MTDIHGLGDLATLIDELTQRVTVLEQELAAHQAGAVRREADIDHLRAEAERLRWSLATGRRP